jgi:hypothetical protein
MASNAERMGWTEYSAHCRDMAEKSIAAGKSLRENETVKTQPKVQLTLW